MLSHNLNSTFKKEFHLILSIDHRLECGVPTACHVEKLLHVSRESCTNLHLRTSQPGKLQMLPAMHLMHWLDNGNRLCISVKFPSPNVGMVHDESAIRWFSDSGEFHAMQQFLKK